jgi:hypothetical protein
MDEVAPNPSSESAMLVANKCSHVISKGYSVVKDEGRSNKYSQHRKIIAPKVRVVYDYEPNIIKTDPENFRSLVQRLTGNFTHKSKGNERQTNQKGQSSEVIASEVGTENLEYTFYSNDQRPIMENKNTKFSTEDCSGLSKGFSDMDMIFHGLHEIPLGRNTSPFYNLYDQTGVYR